MSESETNEKLTVAHILQAERTVHTAHPLPELAITPVVWEWGIGILILGAFLFGDHDRGRRGIFNLRDKRRRIHTK